MFDLEKELQPFDPVNDPETRAKVLARPNPFICLDPFGDVMRENRIITLHGGRGSGKTYAVADSIRRIIPMISGDALICREFQNSIAQSNKREIEASIERGGFDKEWKVTNQEIVHRKTKNTLLFKGLKNNINSIKSISNLKLVWIEEGQTTGKETLELLLPSIRMNGNRIFITMNPEDENSFIYQEMVAKAGRQGYKDRYQIQVNYYDNPYFTKSLESDRQNSLQRIVDAPNEEAKLQAMADYAHIWLGKTKKIVGAAVLKRVEMKEFETPEGNVEFFHGADFSNGGNDPTAMVRCFVALNEKEKTCLWIDFEAYGHNKSLDDLPAMADSFPTLNRQRNRRTGPQWKMRCDSALPIAINKLEVSGFDVEGAVKGAGSVENGIAFLNNFDRIYIHPRCKETLRDAAMYKWKVDRITGEVLPVLAPGNDHAIDALRYALEHLSVTFDDINFLDVVGEKIAHKWCSETGRFVSHAPEIESNGNGLWF